jgi:hypothetical protein
MAGSHFSDTVTIFGKAGTYGIDVVIVLERFDGDI